MKPTISSGALGFAVVLALSACNTAVMELSASKTVSTSAGQEVKVGRYASWTVFCGPIPITVITKNEPAHGKISIRAENWVMTGGQRLGTIDCTGKILQGVGVYYMPQPGFRGDDQVELTVPSGNGTMKDVIAIKVN
jgi:hypothetical protein